MGREILPHEHDLRGWLQRRFVAADDVEDIVQECYCSLSQLADVSHIDEPRAYLFSMARNLAHRQWKKARVVRLETIADAGDAQLESDLPSPERIAAARQELRQLQDALAALPERARQIFILRKVEGLSQKEIARTLGVTEAVVENDASRGLRAVLKRMTQPANGEIATTREASHVRSR